MKKTAILFIFGLISFSFQLSAQVDDMAEHFTKRGYVEYIDYDQKLVLIDYVINNSIESELIQLDNTVFLNEKKVVLTMNDLKFGDEVKIVGDKFPERKYNTAKEITVLDPDIDTSIEGRIDFIKGDVAVIDGLKVKLKPGKKIKGQRKTGFDGDVFDAVTQLKLGIMAKVDGDVIDDYLAVDNFTVAPTADDKYDQEAITVDKESYDKFYPIWSDKNKRATLFGTTIEGVGKIVNDASVQDYVTMVGLKVVPAQLKSKINFIFIVVDNPNLTANVRANGLVYVYTGLLKALDNEAQLATVLGHEIAHVLYKHNAKELSSKERAQKNKENLEKGENAIANTINSIKGKDKEKVGLDDSKQKDINKISAINNREDVKNLKLNYIDHQVSKYSIKQELQADRVGLALMVMAGYDPREVPVVWKNMIINSDPKAIKPIETMDSKIAKEITAAPKKETKGKKAEGTTTKTETTKENPEADNSLFDATATYLIKLKADDFKAKSFQTHPDEVKRFEELNRIIAAVWNNESLYKDNQISVNSKIYQQIKKRLISVKKSTKK